MNEVAKAANAAVQQSDVCRDLITGENGETIWFRTDVVRAQISGFTGSGDSPEGVTIIFRADPWFPVHRYDFEIRCVRAELSSTMRHLVQLAVDFSFRVPEPFPQPTWRMQHIHCTGAYRAAARRFRRFGKPCAAPTITTLTREEAVRIMDNAERFWPWKTDIVRLSEARKHIETRRHHE